MNIVQKTLYNKFRAAQMGGIVGEDAKSCLWRAKTLAAFKSLESRGLARLQMNEEQESYFDVYGEPDTKSDKKRIIESIENLGLYYVYTQTRCNCCGKWETVDSIGMCIYNNPLDPFENDNIISLMDAAIDKAKTEVN